MRYKKFHSKIIPPAQADNATFFSKERLYYRMMALDLEKDLVERAKTDRQAFGRLFDIYYPKIFGYVLNRTANLQAAQDITSDVFFKALNNIGKFRWQGIPFSAWLYRIANNSTADFYKHGKFKQVNLEDVPEAAIGAIPAADEELAAAEEQLSRHQQYLALHANIIKLDTKYQEVITLRFFQSKQINEIAEILGKSEGTIKSLLHRGLEKLKGYLK